MKIKLLLLSITFGLLFSSCEKDTELKGPQQKGRDIAVSTDCQIIVDDDGVAVSKLIAGQNEEVGEVTVEFYNGYIIVTYETKPGWLITETHLHIAANKEILFDEVTNPGGNPMIGLFDYGNDHADKVQEGNTVVYTIQKEPGCYHIAAHAVVIGLAGEEGFVDLDAFNDRFPVDLKGVTIGNYKGNSAYFENITISDGSFLDGYYKQGWCVETGIQYITPGDATAYSSYDLPDGVVDIPQNFDKVNWLINNVYAGMEADEDEEYTMGDIQIAIWALIDGGEPGFPNLLEPWTQAKVDKLLEMAEAEGEGFVPVCGQKIAVVLDYGERQNIIIEYPVKCGEETAWGQGCLFTQRGSWAMYFEVCPQEE